MSATSFNPDASTPLPPVASPTENEKPPEAEGFDESGALYELPSESLQPSEAPEQRVYLQGVDINRVHTRTEFGASLSARAMPSGLQNVLESHGRMGIGPTGGPYLDVGLRLEQEIRYPAREHVGVTSLTPGVRIQFEVKGDLTAEDASRLAFDIDANVGGAVFNPLDGSGGAQAGIRFRNSASVKVGITNRLHAFVAASQKLDGPQSPGQQLKLFLAGIDSDTVKNFNQSANTAELGIGWKQGGVRAEAAALISDVDVSTRGPVNGRVQTDIAAARAAVEYKFGNGTFKLALDGTFTFWANHPPETDPVSLQPASLKPDHFTGQLKLSAEL